MTASPQHTAAPSGRDDRRTNWAVLLDRDGTLSVDTGYLHQVDNLQWIDGAKAAVRRLNRAGARVLVVTNQSGVARGYFTEEDVQILHQAMQQQLRAVGARVDDFYYCPFHPDGSRAPYRRASSLRKPAPGMFERAVAEWDVDPECSFVVGDRPRDVAPGLQLGMDGVVVETGTPVDDHPDEAAAAATVKHAVDRILRARERGSTAQAAN